MIKLNLVPKLLLLLFLLLIATGCQEKREEPKAVEPVLPKFTKVKETKKPQPPKNSVKVTFIELGSVKCIPCKMMQPIMDEISEEFAGQVKVVFYDVWTEEGRPFAEKYGVSAIPTQVFLDSSGKEYYRHVGFFPKEELVETLKTQGVK